MASRGFKKAYALLGVNTPQGLHRQFSALDQLLMKAGKWDYTNPDLLTNKVKIALEEVDERKLTRDEKFWRTQILWLWYHHAITCAIKKGDRTAAKEYAARALCYQDSDHPNKITRLLFLLLHGKRKAAEWWAQSITEEPERSTAQEVLQEYDAGLFDVVKQD